MLLTKKEIFSLRDEIHTVFEKPDDLTDFLNQYEDFKEKLVLKINYENKSLLYDRYLNKFNIYNNKDYDKYRLLTLETYDTTGINFEEEVKSIIFQTNNNLIEYDPEKHIIVKNSFQFQQAISNNYQICHLFGHGSNGIVLTEKERIEPEQLEAWLQNKDNCQCFILNICDSQTIAERISKYVDYVIGMTYKINDDVAIKFAKGFYLGLKNGIDNNQDMFLRGFRDAIDAIVGDKNSQYNIPVLYISYKRAILNLIKQLDTDNKIEYFLRKLHSKLLQNHRFIKIYHKYTYPIKQSYLDRLAEIVNQINNNNLNLVKSAYRETLPENATVDNSQLNNPQNINHIIDILRENYPVVRGNIPSILEFSKNLAGKFAVNSQEYQSIKSWVEEVSSKLNISIDVQPKVESTSTTNQKTFLLIIISPEDKEFRLEAEYILDENQNYQPKIFDFKERLNKERLNIDYQIDTGKGVICDYKKIPLIIEGIINIFLSNHQNEISSSERIIEIFLPYKYLGNNLDNEWRIQDEFEEDMIAIVERYNIIFYPTERFSNIRLQDKLNQSWSKFIQLVENRSNTNSIIENIHIVQKFDNINKRQIVVDLSKKIGLKLIYPLQTKQQEHFLRSVLSGGIPLAFWTRYHTKENINLNDIDIYLTIDCLSNNCETLIDNIYEQIRQYAYTQENPEEHLGYHLGFLCDNPYRIPTIFKPNNSLKSF